MTNVAQADEGWNHYDQLLQFHRDGLQKLLAEVEQKIRLTNAHIFLTVKGQSKNS